MNLGIKLKQIRENRKISQEEVANAIGISQSQYNRLESGETKVSVNRLEKLAKFFKVPIEYFFANEECNFFFNQAENNQGGNFNHSQIEYNDFNNERKALYHLIEQMQKINESLMQTIKVIRGE